MTGTPAPRKCCVMNELPLRFETAVTLVGAGALDRAMVEAARRLAPVLIAADSGADRLAEMRLSPRAVPVRQRIRG